MRAASCCMRLIRRVLRLPNILVSAFVIMKIRASRRETNQKSGNYGGKAERLEAWRWRDLFTGLLQIPHGVHRRPVTHHLEMQMRAGGTTGGTDQRDGLTLLHTIADPDEDGAGMGIAGDQTGLMRDLD